VITVLVSPDELAAGAARVEGDAYRHLFRARRLAAGDRVRAADGRGRARWGEVARVDRRAAVLSLGEPAPANEPAWRLELLVAAPRRERASWLVEKATELGAAAVRLIAAERAPRDWGPGSLDRLRRVAAAALEQCHRAALPEVSGIHPWAELPALLEVAAARWLLDAAPGARPAMEGWRRPPPAPPARSWSAPKAAGPTPKGPR
jgi:16S rRNA (uracil1498-N3)-methyltransferase